MTYTSKLSPEQWAEARRMRADGAAYRRISERLGISVCAVARRARRESWPPPTTAVVRAPPRPQAGLAAAGTASTRSRLALRLYRVIECKIRLMELRMIKQLQAHDGPDGDGLPPPATKEERESFAALIASINQVTEMASDPAPAAQGRKGTASRAVNPELTALSDDIDPDGLAVASEKDQFRRELAEHLGRMFPKP